MRSSRRPRPRTVAAPALEIIARLARGAAQDAGFEKHGIDELSDDDPDRFLQHVLADGGQRNPGMSPKYFDTVELGGASAAGRIRARQRRSMPDLPQRAVRHRWRAPPGGGSLSSAI